MRRKPLFPPVDKATGKPLADKGSSEHTLVNINGTMGIRRRHYYSKQEGTCTPIDALLDAVEATVSQGVVEMAARLNTGAKSFARACEDLYRTAQIRINRESFRQIVVGEGKRALALARSGKLTVGWYAKDCRGEDGKSTLYLSSDGFMAPMVTDAEKRKRRAQVMEKRRKTRGKRRRLGRVKPGADQRYKEFKAVMFYDQAMEHRLVSVTRGDCRAAGGLMARDAGRLGFGAADYRVGNIDGGPWIIGQIKSRHLPMTAVGLDFFHLAENVHKAMHVIYGVDDAAGKALAGEWLHTVKHEGYAPFREMLLQKRSQLRSRANKAAMDQLINYVSDRREMIRYPEFLAHGWQIGSGPMESQCGVIPMRIKGPGKRWDADNAEAVMALEAVHQSNLWSKLWQIGLNSSL